MSVTVPTVRKGKQPVGGPVPGPSHRTKKQGHGKPGVYLLLLLAFAAACAVYRVAIVRTPTGRIVAHFSNAKAMLSNESGFIIRSQEAEALVCPDGSILTLDGDFEHYLVAGPWIAGFRQSHMTLLPADGRHEIPVSINLYPTERPIPVTSGDIAVTFRPGSGLKFGEVWLVRGFSGQGNILWESRVSYAPYIAACNGNILAVGAMDISAGGTPWVVCLSRDTGTVLWQKKLEQGFWRNLALYPAGEISAILDGAVHLLAPNGNPLWVYRPQGNVVSASVSSDVTAIAFLRDLAEPVSKVLGSSAISVIARDGKASWTRASRDLCPRLYTSEEDTVIVLESNRITAYELADGYRFFSTIATGYPTAYAKGVILVEKDRDITLVDFGISRPAR
jgi:hypothetical protein